MSWLFTYPIFCYPIVLCFTFSCLNYLEFSFVYVRGYYLIFFLFPNCKSIDARYLLDINPFILTLKLKWHFYDLIFKYIHEFVFVLCSRFAWSICLFLGQFHTVLVTIVLSYVLLRNQLLLSYLSSIKYSMDKTESYLSLNVKNLSYSLC